MRQLISFLTYTFDTHTVVLCLIFCLQVAAGNIDRDAGGRGDSQEVTALKFKAVETQARFLKRWTSLQEFIYAFHSNIRTPSYTLTLLTGSIVMWAALYLTRMAVGPIRAFVHHTHRYMCK